VREQRRTHREIRWTLEVEHSRERAFQSRSHQHETRAMTRFLAAALRALSSGSAAEKSAAVISTW